MLGRTLPFIVPRESDAVPLIRQHVASGTIIHADESNAWERLHASYDTRRVNHDLTLAGLFLGKPMVNAIGLLVRRFHIAAGIHTVNLDRAGKFGLIRVMNL
jgi:hypothetical protein